jgi:hypothetical protein
MKARRGAIWVVACVAMAAVFLVGVGVLTESPSRTPRRSAELPRYTQGAGTVPAPVLRLAGIDRDALLLEGATTVGNFRLLEPGNAQVFRSSQPGDFVYVVFLYRAPNVPTRSRVQVDTYTARLILDEGGAEVMGSFWVTGTKPPPTEAFGAQFDGLVG